MESTCHNRLPTRVYALEDVPLDPTATFEALRARLFGLAYRMLGSRAEAEDITQEAYVRWHEADHRAIQNPEAWLVTTASRLSIDRLRRLKTEPRRRDRTGQRRDRPLHS